MLILSIDTSTTICSVALHKDGTLLGSYELFTERTSSAMLTTLIDQVVQHTGFSLPQLDAIAVAKGPGSYTGLRIGVSTAKGLCFSLDKPLIAVNTLQGMAEQIRPFYAAQTPRKPILICPMIDARRMEVYCALYDTAGNETVPTSAVIIDETSFAGELAAHTLVFVGDGAAKCRPVLGNHPDALFPETVISPSARQIGVLAAAAWQQGRFEHVVTFEPFYLKDFMATTPRKLV